MTLTFCCYLSHNLFFTFVPITTWNCLIYVLILIYVLVIYFLTNRIEAS